MIDNAVHLMALGGSDIYIWRDADSGDIFVGEFLDFPDESIDVHKITPEQWTNVLQAVGR